MRINQWRGGAIISALAAVIMTVVLAVITLNASTAAPVEAATPGSGQDSDSVASIEDLRVTMADLIPEGKCESDEFIANSMPNTNLKWSDSVSTPFTSNSPNEMFNEVLKENCGNPTFLLMNIEGLSAVNVTGGSTIGSVNPWMNEFAEAFKADPLSYLVKKGDSVHVTAEVTQAAELVNTLLHRLMNKGTVNTKSLVNWHIAPESGLAVGDDKFPTATRNPKQYKGEFLSLEYTLKADNCPALRIGFNTGDKRLAELPVDCDKPKKRPPSDTPPPPKDTPPPPKSTPPPPKDTPPPPKDSKVKVCVKDTAKIIWIKESEFNSKKHTKDLSLCKKKEGGPKPPGKPIAPSPTDPPEKKPPVVETPNPDEKPGDETDIEAPGADPIPSPRPIPPVEGDPDTGPGDPGRP